MSTKQPNDTDLVNELVRNFGDNQKTIAVLVRKVEEVSKTDLDPIVRAKLNTLRKQILIEDVKNQDIKIDLISKFLDSVCSTPQL